MISGRLNKRVCDAPIGERGPERFFFTRSKFRHDSTHSFTLCYGLSYRAFVFRKWSSVLDCHIVIIFLAKRFRILRLVRSCESSGFGTLGSRNLRGSLRWHAKQESTFFWSQACKAVNCFEQCCAEFAMCIGCRRQSTFQSIEPSLGTSEESMCWHLVGHCGGTRRHQRSKRQGSKLRPRSTIRDERAVHFCFGGCENFDLFSSNGDRP